MFFIRSLQYFILLYSVISSPQINLHLTDQISDNESDVVSRHDCLHVAASITKKTDLHEIISYCLTEPSSKLNIEENTLDQKFTFAQLFKQGITSQQLYLWSAPMDVIERFQFYLDYLSISHISSLMATHLFYNCTSPKFGPFCQYSLDSYEPHHSSLYEIIYDFYQQEYDPSSLTCYTHLKCNRGSTSMCLDWTEICDGFMDCRDGVDEESCWQLKLNECREDEYLCANEQCISKTFFRDDLNTFECLDKSDEYWRTTGNEMYFEIRGEPSFLSEDILCPIHHTKLSVKLTSSCLVKRTELLKQLLLFDNPNSVRADCWLAVTCELRGVQKWDPRCLDLCSNRTCREIINTICPDIVNVPSGPIAFGHMFFLYSKEDINKHELWSPPPPGNVCYNDQLCDEFHPSKQLISFNNATCRRPADFPLRFNSAAISRNSWYAMYVAPIYFQLSHCNKIGHNESATCNGLNIYRCINSSKCISKHRLCDRVNDCDYNDDENCSPINDSCLLHGLENLFKCTTTNACISPILIENGQCNCGDNEYGLCDDENPNLHYIRKHISFATICDGFTEMIPVTIDGRNETDETECDYWQCNNTYTRCDGFWNCFNGADEVDCDLSPLWNCPTHHHICVAPKTNQFMCLPLENAADGQIDCLGGTDEPKLCRSDNYLSSEKNFYCINNMNELCITSTDLCLSRKCKDGTDEQFCDKTRNITHFYRVCDEAYEIVRSNVEEFFCARQEDTNKPQIVHFSLGKFPNSTNRITQLDTHSAIKQQTTRHYQQSCHRGLVLRVGFNNHKNSTNIACLCPPSFYGDMCQYQNQRVSLTMRFKVFSDSRRTLFTLVISLIDDSNERIIHSYQQLSYHYIQHCQRKFNVYLLYSTRPKLPARNYSIHIDIYEKKLLLVYRGSLLISVNYSFLSVHRIAVQLDIPRTSDNKPSCSDQQCKHGQCMRYSTDIKPSSFCQCHRGWSGRYCTIPYTCTCSPDSLCVGISANNRSICVCPLNKWGPRCLLRDTVCQSDQNPTCQNGGQCIPIDENMVSDKLFICLCSKGFGGERCEIADNKIIVSFHKNIILSPSILVHFIRVIDNGPPENGSTFKNILTDQKSATILWSRPFHIVFVELSDNNFYLINIQKIYNRSAIISKTINPSDRCKHISELLNETIVKFHLLRRIKYYHVPCQNRSLSLSCFYDDTHFCLCNDYGHHRVANCFEFNHSIKHDCFGQSACENGAQCLQDKATCPLLSICVCPNCFHGVRCQFSSNLFDLSLDAILGYHIQPHISIKHQPSIIHFSVALTTIMIIVSLINGSLSLITFKNKEPRKTGCGVYLLSSSIITLCTTIILLLKFWILIMAQITYMTNRSFLYFQCISMDFLLRVGLNMDQWLNACVGIERAVTIMKGTGFDQKKSKKRAKYIIITLVLFTISTTIHDPIHRHLLNEDADNVDENRIWCIATYSISLRTFNSFILMVHFFTPFIINIISAIIIIIMTARQRTTVQTQQTYQKLLHEQFKKHNHLLIAPLILVGLAVPRLIISFIGGCLKSTSGSWLFLIGYLISFIPSMLTFMVFVLPSKSYKQVFRKTIQQYRRTIRSRLHLS